MDGRGWDCIRRSIRRDRKLYISREPHYENISFLTVHIYHTRPSECAGKRTRNAILVVTHHGGG